MYDGSRKAQKWLYQNQEVKINDLQDALENLTSAESSGKKTDGQQGISLTLHWDNEDFPEITITLFRHGDIQYLNCKRQNRRLYFPQRSG